MQSVGEQLGQAEDKGSYNRKGGANVGYQTRDNVVYERR